MSGEEIKRSLSAVDPHGPVWKALLALCEDEVRSATMDVAAPLLADSGRNYNAGRLAHAIDFRAMMQDICNDIGKPGK